MDPTRKKRRDPYAVAGTAGDALLAAALNAKPALSATEWRVVIVVHRKTALAGVLEWKRGHKTIAAAALAAQSTTRHALTRLAARGFWDYTPGDGRRWSRIVLRAWPKATAARGCPDSDTLGVRNRTGRVSDAGQPKAFQSSKSIKTGKSRSAKESKPDPETVREAIAHANAKLGRRVAPPLTPKRSSLDEHVAKRRKTGRY